MLNFRDLPTNSGFNAVGCGSALLHLAVKPIEERKVLLPTVTHDEGSDPAAFFELFEGNAHSTAFWSISWLSTGSRP